MEAVVAALEDIVPAVHEEDGCELYALHQNNDKVVFVEKWRDLPALDVHRTGPNVKALNEKLSGLVAERDVQILDPVPLGEAEKGTV
jgi:quinol monooxygenase YgiN